MKYEVINKKYTQVINNYLADGWTINTSTMSGTQGEVAHIDLTKEGDVIRVLLNEFHEESNFWIEGLELAVGLVKKGENIVPNKSKYSTIWNNRLAIVARERFYVVGESQYGGKFYGTKEEAEQAFALKMERYKKKGDSSIFDVRKQVLSPRATELGKKYLVRKGLAKRPNNVFVFFVPRTHKYIVTYRNKEYVLE